MCIKSSPLEGVAGGQGRDTRISRQANAYHKEFYAHITTPPYGHPF